MTTLIDTNIIIAVLDPDEPLHHWAVENLERVKNDGPAIISDIVYCEASVAMISQEQMDEAVLRLGLDRITCSDAALFRAGKAFKKYRGENKGPKLGVLPDFIIGSLAETENLTLLTANPKDYVGYFEKIKIINP